ncbi:protein CYPRO4-like protein [Corchorus olitorius]|uniref:Protein CYPRO4-like protein n=1 Tax=Corchorus olitorius TaxID=93759 RepID=A0A1R3J3F2_9ROSI|nr:protein CYPRO4-like protein [Corchorus olitorius]
MENYLKSVFCYRVFLRVNPCEDHQFAHGYFAELAVVNQWACLEVWKRQL